MVARDGVGLCVLNDLTQVVESSLLELLKLLTRSSRCVSHVCHNFGPHRSHVRLLSDVGYDLHLREGRRSRTTQGHCTAWGTIEALVSHTTVLRL